MDRDILFFVRFFSIVLPFFTAMTGVVIVASSCRNRETGLLSRRLLTLLLALMGTWAGFFLYFFVPDMLRVFLPVYALSVLCVPVGLYAYIHRLVCGAKIKSMMKHYIAPAIIALEVAIFTYYSDEWYQIMVRPGLALHRLAFSVAYATPTLYLLWQEYRRKQQSRKTPQLPTDWLLVLVTLTLIQLVNSIILLVGSKQPHPLAITAGALLISALITVLLYNTICRNLDLFRAKSKKSIGRPRKPIEEEEKHIPLSLNSSLTMALRLKLEQVFLEEKLYLNPDVSLATICERFETNRTYLSTFINHEYGMNFKRWVNFHRLQEMEHLRTLPLYEKMSMSKLCVMAGFKNYHYYRRAMKENQKITPEESTDGNN